MYVNWRRWRYFGFRVGISIKLANAIVSQGVFVIQYSTISDKANILAVGV